MKTRYTKSMRIFLIQLIIVLSAIAGQNIRAHAENNYKNPKFQFGIRAGAMINQLGQDFNYSEYCLGWNLGLSANWRLGSKPFYLESGTWVDFMLNREGYFTAEIKTPLLVSYHFPLHNNCTIGPFGGPFLAFSTGYDTSNANYVDCGARIGCQFNWKKLYANIGGDFGFIPRHYGRPQQNIGTTIGFFLTIGCNFISR